MSDDLVKPLVWYKLGVEQKASTPFGPYIVASYDAGEWGCWMPNEDIEDDPGHGFHSTEEAAKAYAQDHFLKCILSALEPADERVKALVGALEKRDAMRHDNSCAVGQASYCNCGHTEARAALATITDTGGKTDG